VTKQEATESLHRGSFGVNADLLWALGGDSAPGVLVARVTPQRARLSMAVGSRLVKLQQTIVQ
jgi:hypothetical protein